MYPQYEQMLRNEVIYLHSLWHQGPPGRHTAFAAPTQPHCQAESTQLDITNPNFNTRKRKCNEFSENSFQESSSSTGAKWPCPTPPPPTTGWQIAEKPNPDNPTELSQEEKLIWLARHSQQRALKAVKKFFTGNSNSDKSDAIGSSSEEDDGDDERDECSFLRNLLRDDTELREYYRSNVARGMFSCLVCEGVGGRRVGKKYQDCLALVQHSISISKTKKKRAHRAFALAVCEVLGCDIGHLPSVASMLSEVQGNVDFVKKNSSITLVSNVDSREGTSGKAAIESGTIVSLGSEHKSAELQVDSLEGNIGVMTESGASVSLPAEQGAQGGCSLVAQEKDSNSSEVVLESGTIDTGIIPSAEEDNMILARQIDMVWRSLQNRGALKGSNGVGGEPQDLQIDTTKN